MVLFTIIPYNWKLITGSPVTSSRPPQARCDVHYWLFIRPAYSAKRGFPEETRCTSLPSFYKIAEGSEEVSRDEEDWGKKNSAETQKLAYSRARDSPQGLTPIYFGQAWHLLTTRLLTGASSFKSVWKQLIGDHQRANAQNLTTNVPIYPLKFLLIQFIKRIQI